jgi:uncharacterized phage protein (TIGR01671 family)
MIRIPKYRAYNKILKEMREVSTFYNVGTEDLEIGVRGTAFSDPLQPIEMYWSLEESVLMQWTGLNDSNGQDIYEGDIITYKAMSVLSIIPGMEPPILKHIVMFNDGMFGIRFGDLKNIEPISRFLQYHTNTLKVIGNIYENPELVEQK